MKHLLLLLTSLLAISVGNAEAQSPEVLNQYRSVFIPQLFYGENKVDIYDIRKTVVDKLTLCQVPMYLDENKIPVEVVRNPCSMLHCIISNSAGKTGHNASIIHIVFIGCNNDTVFHCFADAPVLLTSSETKKSFISSTKQALSVFDGYEYHFNETESSVIPDTLTTESDSIEWNPGRKLTWDDFKGKAIDDDPADALTYTAHQTEFQSFLVGNRFEVDSKVNCYFIKSHSWVKAGKQIDFLLNHEQRHFDIAEVGARDFRKRLKEAHFTNENFQRELKRIAQEIDTKYHNLQVLYDGETDHSRIAEKQEEWNKKIDSLLKESGQY